MLNKVTVDDLRGVGRVELRFEPDHRVRVLFGSNGVGKTKCLEAIFEYLLLSNKDFLAFADQDLMRPTGLVMTRMTTDCGPGTLAVRTDELRFSKCVWPKQADAWHSRPVVFLGAAQRSNLSEGSASAGSVLLGTASDRRKAYFGAVAQSVRDGRLGSLGMSSDIRAWFVARAQSVNPYQKVADNRQVEIDAVLALLSAVDQRINAKRLEIDGAGHVFLAVEGQLRELGELSSGFTSLVKLVQAIIAGYAAFTNEVQLEQVPGVVLIDEIESHLHPVWQSCLIPQLKTLLPNTTFFVATHSPIVLSQLQEGEAYLLQRDADGVVRSHVIDSPDRRAFVDVLDDALGIDLNRLKLDAMAPGGQTSAKRRLLDFLADRPEGT